MWNSSMIYIYYIYGKWSIIWGLCMISYMTLSPNMYVFCIFYIWTMHYYLRIMYEHVYESDNQHVCAMHASYMNRIGLLCDSYKDCTWLIHGLCMRAVTFPYMKTAIYLHNSYTTYMTHTVIVYKSCTHPSQITLDPNINSKWISYDK